MSSLPNVSPPELGLGTVQFGLPYGVSNQTGQTPPEVANAIIRDAWHQGIRYLDTAVAYGSAEKVIGASVRTFNSFKVITKLPMLPPDITDGAEIRAWVQATVSESLNNIGIHELYGVLLHNPLDAIGPRGAEIFAGLEACKNMGLVKKIGVSIYEREQLERTCGTYPIEIVQIPVNIFDQRLTSDELLPNMRRRGLEIHARSVFLQGLLLMAYETVPAYFNPIRQHLRNFHDACREYEVTPMSLALAFIKNCALDVALVGVNTRDQLSEIVAKYNSIPEDVRICNFDKFALHEPKFINPSLWAVGS